jgi:hypothetical protein
VEKSQKKLSGLLAVATTTTVDASAAKCVRLLNWSQLAGSVGFYFKQVFCPEVDITYICHQWKRTLSVGHQQYERRQTSVRTCVQLNTYILL